MDLNWKVNKKRYIIIGISLLILSVFAGAFLFHADVIVASWIVLIIAVFIFATPNDGFNILRKVVMLMMVHTFLVLYFFPTVFNLNKTVVSFLLMWKEIVLATMFCYILFRKKTQLSFKSMKFDKLLRMDIAMIIFTLLCVISLLIFPNKVSGLYGMRNYLIGFMIYYIAKNVRYQDKDILKFISNISYLLVFLSLWGIIQSMELGPDFIIKYGYGSAGKLFDSFYIAGHYGTQRVTSTFEAPNTFAIVALIPALFFMGKIILLEDKKLITKISLGVVVTAIILSFSRSVWIALFFGTFLILVFKFGKDTRKYMLFIGKFVLIVLIITVLFYFIAPNIYNRTIGMVTNHLSNTISMKDPSAKGHAGSLKDSLQFLIDNPFGVGIGKSGPRSGKYNNVLLNSESSYFVVGFDFGIIGLIIYFYLIFQIFKRVLNCIKSHNYYISFSAKILLTILVGTQISYFFLPLIQDLNHIYIIYALLGLISGLMLKENSLGS